MPSTVNEDCVKSRIEFLSMDYQNEMKKLLDIEDMHYELTISDVYKDEEHFPEPKVCACIALSETEKKVDRMLFFTHGICNSINSKYSKLHENMFIEVILLEIKYFFIHELVHVKQRKNGMTNEDYKATSYENSPYEKEANDFAVNHLSSEGDFSKHIVELISGRNKRCIDAPYLTELEELFKEQYKL